MYDLLMRGRHFVRKRFQEWLAEILQEWDTVDCALLLLSRDGTIIECASGMDENKKGSFKEIRVGDKWQSIACGDDAVTVSLQTAALVRAKSASCLAGSSVRFASAAAPIAEPSGFADYWLALLAAESSGTIINMFPFILRSLSEDRLKGGELSGFGDANVLLEMARSLSGKIDVSEVLTETIAWMSRRFPTNPYDLLLSQDNNTVIHPVKPFFIRNPENDLCSKAFIEGHLVRQEHPDRIEVAAPLKGKQGSYGVLHLVLSNKDRLEENIAFLVALSEYAGSAFEIAKLYEQSTKLVNELKTINEMTKRLNRSLQLNDIFQFVDRELLEVFAADYCCILLKDQSRQYLVVKASNAEELVNECFDVQYGFGGIICRSKEPVIISDYQFDKHVDSKLMITTQAKSLIGAPIIVNSETVGAILLVHRQPNYFSFENFKLLQVLSGHVGLAVTNATLHAEMRKMVITDQLTGLFVRHYLYEQIQFLQKKDACGSLIVFDLDDFKRVNDTYGHQVGDNVLIQVSEIVSRSIRDTDIAARWGGEELAVYLPLMNSDQAFKVADRIRNLIAQETEPQVTISCGIADWRQDDERVGLDNLFHDADMALYEAKKSGKNQIRLSCR